MIYQYVAVDITRSKILLIGDSMQDLHKQFLSEEGQKLIHKQALWTYRVEKNTLLQIQNVMTKTGASFAQVTRPSATN
jgi:hypothetical protein